MDLRRGGYRWGPDEATARLTADESTDALDAFQVTCVAQRLHAKPARRTP